MGCVAIFRRFVPGIVISFLLCGQAVAVQAAGVDVTAQIPYPIPTQPAVIGNPANGSSFQTATQNISGACEISTPSFIVSLWENGQSIGSTVCQSNATFSMTIQLSEGTHNFLPRTSNISNIYGPDGLPFSISYFPPETPNSPQEQIPGLPAGSDLSITSTLPFGILSSSDNSVTVEIIVRGSATPFRITINWGDGASDTKSVAEPGTYSFSHTYDKAAVYDVRATVTDILGVIVEYSFPVVPSSIGSAAAKDSDVTAASAHKGSSVLLYIIGIIILTALTFVAGERYMKVRLAWLSKRRTGAASKKRRQNKT